MEQKLAEMKKKISVSVDEELIPLLDEAVEGSVFRNKSHLIEYAVKRLLRGNIEKDTVARAHVSASLELQGLRDVESRTDDK